MFADSFPVVGAEDVSMRYRCALCDVTNRDPTSVTEHVFEEHRRRNFGWYVERVPESRSERAIAWISNAPVRARHRLQGLTE